MDLANFEVVNPTPFSPTMRIMRNSIVFNIDAQQWLADGYITLRINTRDKQIAIVREPDSSTPNSFKPINVNGKQPRINNAAMARTIREVFQSETHNFTLKGTMQEGFLLFK